MIMVGTCPVVVLSREQHIFYERAVISVCNVESFSKTSDCGLQEVRKNRMIHIFDVENFLFFLPSWGNLLCLSFCIHFGKI